MTPWWLPQTSCARTRGAAVAARQADGAGVTESVGLPDGRVLAYEDYGDPAGFPVLSFHGGLSSRLDAEHAHEAAVGVGRAPRSRRTGPASGSRRSNRAAVCSTGPTTWRT